MTTTRRLLAPEVERSTATVVGRCEQCGLGYEVVGGGRLDDGEPICRECGGPVYAVDVVIEGEAQPGRGWVALGGEATEIQALHMTEGDCARCVWWREQLFRLLLLAGREPGVAERFEPPVGRVAGDLDHEPGELTRVWFGDGWGE